MSDLDKLIYGKSGIERVVGLEVNENEATLFLQNEQGDVNKRLVGNKFWVLTNKATGASFKLQGNLHYQYGRQFLSGESKNKFIGELRKKNADFFTIWDQKESLMVKDGYCYYQGMTHTEPSILSFDIESTGLFHNADSKVLLISNTFRKNGRIERRLFAYDEYANQGEMLLDWCRWVREMDPSIIAGHNIYTYDFPYLQYIAEQQEVGLCLGRDCSNLSINPKASKFRIDGSRDQEYHKVRCYGREIIDTMFLAIRHDIVAKKYESYGLKSIIKVEGLEKHDRVHYDSSTIRFNYKDSNEWRKIRDYCIHDSEDALAIFDLCAPASFYLTHSIPKSFQSMVESAPGSQINSMLVRSYIQDGHSIPKASLPKPLQGAISFGNSGIYRNVHKVDVASMYPSIVLSCKVYDEDKDPKGNFLKIMDTFTNERLKNKALYKETKNKYYDDLQNAQKIIINSGYGFMAAPGLNFNSPGAAEFITATGRTILNSAIEWARLGNYDIPNADTDSISYCRRDGQVISEMEREKNLAEINALLPERIRFEDDGYFSRVCIFKAKNYALDDGKKVKIKGSALKASTKCSALKEMINKFIDSFLKDRNDFKEIYESYIKEACNITDIKRWANRKTISERTLNSERTNETRIKDTIAGTEYVEGDRIYTFFLDKDKLELVERFDGKYHLDAVLKACYDTVNIFEEVLNMDQFINYKLKKNKPLLEKLNESKEDAGRSYHRENLQNLSG